MLKVFSNIFVAFVLLILVAGCEKEKETPAVVHETGTVTDIDGNIYTTIKIGNQWWMAENLKVKTYNNGQPILKFQTDTTDWNNDTTGAYCIYDNSSTAPGLLYNFYAISNANRIAPAGWHVPTDEEWKTLERQLGITASEADKSGWRGTNEGEKLKKEGTQGWSAYQDVWPTNESGFTALAGSCRLFDGTWGAPGLFATGFWWSNTSQENEACYRYLDYKTPNVFRSHTDKHYGFSVRCVKD